MEASTRRRLLWGGGVLLVGLLVPGWRGTLHQVPHEQVLAAARGAAAGAVLAVEVTHAGGGTWHAQYVDRGPARALRSLGIEGGIARLVAPDHAARIVDGKPVSYHRVEQAVHWPWWRSGGGVDWPGAEPD